jgi:hypothetical protein
MPKNHTPPRKIPPGDATIATLLREGIISLGEAAEISELKRAERPTAGTPTPPTLSQAPRR